MNFQLTANEIFSIKKAAETNSDLEREVIINERDNQQDYNTYQPYLSDGETTMSNGQQVKVEEHNTDEGLRGIKITPITGESMAEDSLGDGVPPLDFQEAPETDNEILQPKSDDEKSDQEILVKTISDLVKEDTPEWD